MTAAQLPRLEETIATDGERVRADVKSIMARVANQNPVSPKLLAQLEDEWGRFIAAVHAISDVREERHELRPTTIPVG
jgi:hypothetical protein